MDCTTAKSTRVMNRFFFFFFTLYFSFAGQAQKQTRNNLDSISWLLGHWEMKLQSGVLHEDWKRRDEHSFEGNSYIQTKNGEKKLLESVLLVASDSGRYYIPTTMEQNNRQPVPFKLSTYTSRNFIAENKEHDFPQRIEYSSDSAGQLSAIVDGKENGNYRKEEFFFLKAVE
jgi:hypothetical protein